MSEPVSVFALNVEWLLAQKDMDMICVKMYWDDETNLR